MKKILVLLALTILFMPAYAQDENYCHDKESWKEWDELVQKYPESRDIQILHAVRIGLCKKIEDGSISFEISRDAFNHMHDIVIKRAQEKKKQYLRSKQL